MTGRGWKVAGLIIVVSLAVGCIWHYWIRQPETVIEYWTEGPQAPRWPLISCVELEERDGLMRWKEGGAPFTGSVIECGSMFDGGFSRAGYVEGVFIDSWAEEFDPEQISDTKPYRDAIRRKAERVGLHHDDYLLYYIPHGEESDLPVLLYSLKKLGKYSGDPEQKLMDCEWCHCLEALQEITGANPGIFYDDWAGWYKEHYGETVPEWKPAIEREVGSE